MIQLRRSRRVSDVDDQALADGGERALNLADVRAVAKVEETPHRALADAQTLTERDVGKPSLAYRDIQRELGGRERWNGHKTLASPRCPRDR